MGDIVMTRMTAYRFDADELKKTRVEKKGAKRRSINQILSFNLLIHYKKKFSPLIHYFPGSIK